MYRSNYALVAAAGGTAVLGFAYWAVAARTFRPEQVGLQSVLVTTMLFLAGLSQLSLNSVLIRFLPVAGRHTRALVATSYAISAAAAVATAGLFVAGTGWWSPQLSFLQDDPTWLLAFVGACAVWCVFSLQDSVLIALRKAPWVPIENIAVSGAKIALLLVLQSRLPHAGLFASWVVPALVAVIVVNGLLARATSTAPAAETHSGALPPTRALVRFTGGNYVGFVFYAASTNLLPLVVLNRSGAEAAAFFYVPWAITSALLLVPASTATSLTVESALDLRLLAFFSRRTLTHTLMLLAPPVALLLACAPLLLRLFGSGYAAGGATTLRLLAAGVVPNAVVLVGLGVLRVRNRVARLAAVQAGVCVMVLGGSYLLLPEWGIAGVGVAYALAQTAAAVVLLATDLRSVLGRVPAPE